jgi:dienelactone hydrolase
MAARRKSEKCAPGLSHISSSQFSHRLTLRPPFQQTSWSRPTVLLKLQQRLARERGEMPTGAPATTIEGYPSKPDGSGPFPAIVYLHGCDGLSANARSVAAEVITGWGYVSLAVDSFATRGIKGACDQPIPDRQADALGALLYLSKLAFVDPKRIAVLGSSQGGIIALHDFSATELAK